MRVDAGQCLLTISNYLTWNAVDQRALAYSVLPTGVGNVSCSVVARLSAGTYIDVQLMLMAAGTWNVLKDSHGGGNGTDVSSLTIAKL